MSRTLVFYPVARTYHLARPPLEGVEHVRFLQSSYDFDDQVSERDREVRVVSWHRLLRDTWRLAPDVVEVPEPLWLKFAPLSVVVVLAARLSRVVRRRPRPRAVTYAIENNALDDRYLLFGQVAPSGVRRMLVRILLRLSARLIDRVVYGSEAARDAYARANGGPWLRDELVVVEIVSTTTQGVPSGPHPCSVSFVGELHERKGIDRLVAAWPAIRAARPDATLTVVGDGPLRPSLERAAARAQGSIELTGVLRSHEVASVLRSTCVAVQVSQPHIRWREQIGLPIREAVEAGCRLVTTPETGLAPLLARDANATLVPVGCSAEQVAAAVTKALDGPHPHVGWTLDTSVGYAQAIAVLHDC